MSLGHGVKISKMNSVVFVADAYDPMSNFLNRSSSNILPDPYYWSIGTGSSSGYGANGSASEQSRDHRTDPFGGTGITWRSTPDSTSGADGGWDSSYYAIDKSYTYRWSTYIRRHTAATGGNFYLGMNPAPIRNDNDALQGNPYFTYPAISLLTQDQWYLVVGHCFFEGYTGGRHPDSGWYEIQSDGSVKKIGDKSYGNLGTQDVRWPSSTTSSMHRSYHYYTTDTSSGIEWAYPRLDKCDGTEPSIKELCSMGPGKFYNRVKHRSGSNKSTSASPSFSTLGGAKTWVFDSVNEWFDGGNAMLRTLNTYATFEAWIYPAATEVTSGDRGTIIRLNTSSGSGSTYVSWNKDTRKISSYWYGTSPEGYHEPGPALNREEWHHVAVVWDGTNHHHYINGVRYSVSGVTGPGTAADNVEIGMEGTTRQFAGGISMVRIYDAALTELEIKANFDATRGRYGK